MKRFHLLVGTIALAGLGSSRPSLAQGTTLESLGADPSASSSNGQISADGRYLVFQCNGQVYRRDCRNQTTELVSVDCFGGTTAGGVNPSISPDGRFVVFESPNPNLVCPDPVNWDVFVCDMNVHPPHAEMVSVSSSGLQGDSDSVLGLGSKSNMIPAGGRFVVFQSKASNLDPLAPSPVDYAVFLRDREAGTTKCIQPNPGNPPFYGSDQAVISADGSQVVFRYYYKLPSGSLVNELWGYEPLTGVGPYLIYAWPSGAGTFAPSITADGSTITFTTPDSVFLLDLAAAVPVPVAEVLGFSCGNACISGDGTKLVFLSTYGGWGACGPTNGNFFIRDLSPLGLPECVSVGLDNCRVGGLSGFASISHDGRFVAFDSGSSLVPGDTNAAGDVFVRDFSTVGTPFSFGDGSGTVCPCNNGGLALNGCANSVNAQGAYLSAVGEARISSDSLRLRAMGMPNSTTLFFQGTNQENGGHGVWMGDGLRGVAGTLVRLGSKPIGLGTACYPVTPDPSLSVRGGVNSPGVRMYQAWYRNPAAFCTPDTFNLTNALRIDWLP